MTISMVAVGLIVWRALERQGYGSPPTDDPEPTRPADGHGANGSDSAAAADRTDCR